MKVFDKIGQVFVDILIILIAVIAFFSIYSFVVLDIMGNNYVSLFGYTYFEVVSGSMEPSISVNDVVIVKVNSEFEQGDIITYYSDSDFVTHRVVSMDDRYVITKGDYNNTKDKGVSYDSVVGKVVLIIPKAGIWKNIFMMPKVIISLVFTLVFLCFSFSYTPKKKNRKIKKKKKNSIKDNEYFDVDVIRK